jgi:hypothetical protein
MLNVPNFILIKFEHNSNHSNGDSAKITTHRQSNMSFMKKAEV